MEENIMTMTEEFVDTAEDIAIAEPGKNVGVGLAVGATVVAVGALAYRFIVKPIAANIKDKKAQKAADAEAELDVVCDSTESDEK